MLRNTFSAFLTLSVLTATSVASAQDVIPPLPNVLLLVDTSGSMERLPSGQLPYAAGDTSMTPINAGQVTTVPNRWASAIQVLTGSIQGFQLLAEDRTTADYAAEFGLGTGAVYDTVHNNLMHYRPIFQDSGGNYWTIGAKAGDWPLGWENWSYSSFGCRKFNPATGTLGAVTTCPVDPTSVFKTSNLGILDTFATQARFGLMTFDDNPETPSPLTGCNMTGGSEGACTSHDPVGGMTGMWSYFPGWWLPASSPSYYPVYGWPYDCTDVATNLGGHLFEVGARNPSAPPWEGPLIRFSPSDSTTDLLPVVDRIRYSLLSERPYGPTPIASMLRDAQYFLRSDPWGPSNTSNDPYATCRSSFIILITDGYSDLDLRSACYADPNNTSGTNLTSSTANVYSDQGQAQACNMSTGTGGCCPAKNPQDIALALANPATGAPINTFVIGFAVSDINGNVLNCQNVNPISDCPTIQSTDSRYPCCVLNQIAYSGSNGKNPAYFATDATSLRMAIAQAMSAATAKTSYSRTVPVYASNGTSSSATGEQFQINTGFQVQQFSLWQGMLSRTLYKCQASTCSTGLTAQPAPHSDADNFAEMMQAQAGQCRNIFTWTSSGNLSSATSIRPNISGTPDAIPQNMGTVVSATAPNFVTTLSTATTAAAQPPLELASQTCTTDASLSACASRILGYSLALPNSSNCPSVMVSGVPTTNITCDRGEPNSCNINTSDPLLTTCPALADIYHASPVLVMPPSQYIRDEAYEAFRNGPSCGTGVFQCGLSVGAEAPCDSSAAGSCPSSGGGGTCAQRPTIMLAATNDGQLHAFLADPPASEYTSSGNGAASIANSAELWSFIPPAVLPNLSSEYGGVRQPLLDAAPVVKNVAFGSTSTTPYGISATSVEAGQAHWATVALGALTSTANGHSVGYYALDITNPTAPRFLWQLTDMVVGAAKYPMFGSSPGTPAIGTVFYSEGGVLTQTPVAFLPGGNDTQANTALPNNLCNRWGTYGANVRAQTHCYNSPAQSLTIVRLYDGKVLRTFRDNPYGDGSGSHPANFTGAAWQFESGAPTVIESASTPKYAQLDNPISGVVTLYPATEATVTTRAFVGDNEGTLWKIDVSANNPQYWTMSLFHDAYNPQVSQNLDFTQWQGIYLPPVLSVDPVGDIVIDYATGDQENLAPNGVNHLYSISEVLQTSSGSTSLAAQVNWHLMFTGGERVTGPLSLFNNALYFATYQPPTPSGGMTTACQTGIADIWAVDYLQPEPGATSKLDGAPLPMARWNYSTLNDSCDATAYTAAVAAAALPCPDSPLTNQYPNEDGRQGMQNYYRCQSEGGGAIFGLSVTERPTCLATTGSTTPQWSGDPFIGATTGDTNPPGASSPTFDAGFMKNGAFSQVKLQPPATSAHVDAWGAVIE